MYEESTSKLTIDHTHTQLVQDYVEECDKDIIEIELKRNLHTKDVEYLRSLQTLEKLTIINCLFITEELCTLDNLVYLNVQNNGLSAESAKNISQMKRLTSLNISFNQILDKGAMYISSMIQLTSLNIGFNKIGIPGIQYLSNLIELTVLQIGSSFIGKEGAEYISRLKKLTHLDIRLCNVNDDGVMYISSLKNLVQLDVHLNKITAIGAQYISSLQNLVQLDISINRITDVGVMYISTLPNLTNLNITGNEITFKGARQILAMKKLVSLDISHNRIESKQKCHQGKYDTCAMMIASMQQLTYLNIVYTGFLIEDVDMIVASLPNLLGLSCYYGTDKIDHRNDYGNDYELYQDVQSKMTSKRKQYWKSFHAIPRIKHVETQIEKCIHVLKSQALFNQLKYDLESSCALVVLENIIARQLEVYKLEHEKIVNCMCDDIQE